MFWRHSLEARGGSWNSFRLYGFSARLVPLYVSSAVVFVFVLFCKVSFPVVYFLSVRIWCRKITFRKKAPSTRIIRFCWETEGFFSCLAYRSHVFGENGHLKQSPGWNFLKTLATCLSFSLYPPLPGNSKNPAPTPPHPRQIWKWIGTLYELSHEVHTIKSCDHFAIIVLMPEIMFVSD